jgi:hypothetical protein
VKRRFYPKRQKRVNIFLFFLRFGDEATTVAGPRLSAREGLPQQALIVPL